MVNLDISAVSSNKTCHDSAKCTQKVKCYFAIHSECQPFIWPSFYWSYAPMIKMDPLGYDDVKKGSQKGLQNKKKWNQPDLY